MNDISDPDSSWRNPLFIENAATERIAESLLLARELRRKTSAGLALGTFLIELPNASTLTAIAQAGFDFVVLDMEHSSIDFSSLEALISAGQAAGLATLVRPWGKDTGQIGKLLDIGAHGVMAPHVETPKAARAIVEQARFAPAGNRGFSPLTKYDSLSTPLTSLNDSTYVVVQIEGHAALEKAREIASVEGIDAAFVGPYDLALSLGVAPGCEEVYEAAERIARSIPEGVDLGIYMDDPAKSGTWLARGFSLQCISFDGRMLADGARAVVEKARRSATQRARRRENRESE